jgi:phosphatidylserine/phosphatidylglycerophosphate/cardiolipin synthase-like enzyme
MRIRKKAGPLSVHAIAGPHGVLLGMDLPKGKAKGLLGFAIHRSDLTEDERYWLSGFKTFQATFPDPAPGSLVSTREHPIQAFQWGDYTAKPDHRYRYRVVALYGKPAALEPRHEVSVEFRTPNPADGRHAVFFNRGLAASQAYARKFGNRKPKENDPSDPAWAWLSRGLEEALIAFIREAKDAKYSLRGAFYEFTYKPVLLEFKQAKQRGVDVKIVYDARPGGGQPLHASDPAIDATGIRSLMVPRTVNPSFIQHNKFLVLLKNGAPVAVWTGSTNLSRGGIFGQSNAGHIVRDPATAQSFLDYWTRLAADPTAAVLRVLNEAAGPVPAAAPPKGIATIFSPRGSKRALDWYGERMDASEGAVCFTAAFGVNPVIENVLAKDKDYLRYVLLEKEDDHMQLIRQDPDTRIAVAGRIDAELAPKLHRWLGEELTGLNAHVHYIHTKYLLLNPLSKDPVVIAGSANFSDASTTQNDENMLVIRGDTDVADVYLTEFMRLFNHLYFRDVIRRFKAKPASELRKTAYLAGNDSWTANAYRPGRLHHRERLLFR